MFGFVEAIMPARAAKNSEEMRAAFSSVASSVPSGRTALTLRRTLCDHTVPIARMAPSPVDMEAATMPTRIQQPMKADIGKLPTSP